MSRQEALEIVRTRASAKYRGARLMLLETLVRLAFSENGQHKVTVKADTLARRIGVQRVGLHAILKAFEADGLVEHIRHNHKITYTVNLKPLSDLSPIDLEAKVKEQKSKRADKARAVYHDKRKRDFVLQMRDFLLQNSMTLGMAGCN